MFVGLGLFQEYIYKSDEFYKKQTKYLVVLIVEHCFIMFLLKCVQKVLCKYLNGISGSFLKIIMQSTYELNF